MIVDAWIAIAALAMFVYVALDGYDLGIGILMVGQRDPARRREWTELVDTASDGNESWIVLVGALLLAGVPGAFDVLLPILFVPVAVMVLSLIVRRAALVAMRSLPRRSDRWTSLLFATGSLLAGFSQGVAVAALAERASWPAANSRAEAFDFLSLYSVLGGFTAIAVYAVAGSVWGAYKADGSMQRQARRNGAVLMPLAAGLVALTAGLLPMPPTASLLSDSSGRVVLVACAVLVGSTLGVGWTSERRSTLLVAAAIVAVEVVAVGIIVGLRLAEMLPQPTNAHVGAPTSALYFVLIAIAPCMPIVLFMNGYALLSFLRKLVPSGARSIEAAPSINPKMQPVHAVVGV